MYFMYISPTLADITALSSQKAQFSDILSKSKQLKNQRDAVLTSYNNIAEDDINRLNKIIPDKFDTVLLISDLNALASRYGLVMSNFKVDAPTASVRNTAVTRQKTDLYKTITVGFSVSGPYDAFVSFLKDAESSLRLMDITSLNIKSSSQKGDSSLQYTLQLYTYSLR